MNRADFRALFNAPLPVFGMLHAPPLPGAPGFDGNLAALRERVLADADALADGGVHALMLENFGDTPFFPGRVPAETVAHLTALAVLVRARSGLPLGINVLRNDGLSALAIADAVGAQMIRVNVLTGARVTDQGVVSGIAHELLRLRSTLCAGRSGAAAPLILADASVKHSAPLGAARPIQHEVADLFSRGGADAVVVSGAATGAPTDPDEVRRVRQAAGDRPVLVGSGVTAANVAAFVGVADAIIVGASLKTDGSPTSPVDPQRVKQLLAALG